MRIDVANPYFDSRPQDLPSQAGSKNFQELIGDTHLRPKAFDSAELIRTAVAQKTGPAPASPNAAVGKRYVDRGAENGSDPATPIAAIPSPPVQFAPVNEHNFVYRPTPTLPVATLRSIDAPEANATPVLARTNTEPPSVQKHRAAPEARAPQAFSNLIARQSALAIFGASAHVIVSGDLQLRIVVAAVEGFTEDDLIALKRSILAMASDHGLTIQALTLNGVTLAGDNDGGGNGCLSN